MPDNTLSKIRQTLQGDIVLTRNTGRLNWRRVIDKASLDELAKAVIKKVVRKTRLWRIERYDVARELVVHFLDARDADVSTERAIERFGDVRQAAKLIRRAKVRNRSSLWHAMRFTGRIVAVLIVLYVILAIRFVIGQPDVKVDYVARINASIKAVPLDQRAWPLYRDAMVAMGFNESEPDALVYHVLKALEGTGKSGMSRAGATKWLRDNAPHLEQVRKASQRPSLGFVLGDSGSMRDGQLFGSIASSPAPPVMAGVIKSELLPHLNHFSTLKWVIVEDARLALEDTDPDRFERNVTSLFRMSEQLRHADDFLISGMVACGLRSAAIAEVGNALQARPEKLSSAMLGRLEKQISNARLASDLFTFQTERFLFMDVIQRLYTDDGNGDGRLTARGLEGLQTMFARASDNRDIRTSLLDSSIAFVGGPVVMVGGASRREMTDAFNAYIDAMEQRLKYPLRDAKRSAIEQKIDTWQKSPTMMIRYSILVNLSVTMSNIQRSAERVLAKGEGVEVGIALELYKRDHGSYPASADLLVPKYLKELPADRVDGAALRYPRIDGKPIVYSVGEDRDDDTGRAPPNNGNPIPWKAGLRDNKDKPVDGDWILYPTPTDAP